MSTHAAELIQIALEQDAQQVLDSLRAVHDKSVNGPSVDQTLTWWCPMCEREPKDHEISVGMTNSKALHTTCDTWMEIRPLQPSETLDSMAVANRKLDNALTGFRLTARAIKAERDRLARENAELRQVCQATEKHYAMLCEVLCRDNPPPGGQPLLLQLRAVLAKHTQS